MKRLLLVALLAIVAVGSARAQDNAIPSQANLAADFANTSTAPKVPDVLLWVPSGSGPNSTFAERETPVETAEASALLLLIQSSRMAAAMTTVGKLG